MDFIYSEELKKWFDTNKCISDCIPSLNIQSEDSLLDKLFGGNLFFEKLLGIKRHTNNNDDLLQKYYNYCFWNDAELRDWFEEYLRDLGYSSTEGVDDGYEEYCRESYSEVCSKKELPLFDLV